MQIHLKLAFTFSMLAGIRLSLAAPLPGDVWTDTITDTDDFGYLQTQTIVWSNTVVTETINDQPTTVTIPTQVYTGADFLSDTSFRGSA